MIRRIYTTVISFALAALTFTSCSDWLELYPADEIKEEYLFSSGDGFRTAMNGIYRKMSTFNLYGSNLTWGIIDAWGQSYYIDKSTDNGGGKAMKKIAAFKFKNSELTPTTDEMWNAAWNVVANCNNLAQQAEAADSMIFYGRERERQMILAEAIGLRAVMQFDLLRIYAPAPVSMNKNDSRTFIPYVDTYPSYVNDHQTVGYCLDKIVADLKEAQRILQKVDKSSKMNTDGRYSNNGLAEEVFLGFRGYRLNYYAATAILARVYLYAGKNAEAYAEAKKIIDVNSKERYFNASTSKYNIESYGNMKMYDDIIFALYSPTELVDWDHEINHSSDGASTEYYLCIHKSILAKIYGEDVTKDWRAVYQLEPLSSNYYYRQLKYNEQPAKAKYALVNNQTIPMIRMSEVYYIAAEAIFETNPDEAKEYLKTVKKGRGLTVDYSEVSDKDEFINLLENDARREFFGEGQILYMYKRLNRSIKTSDPYSGEDIMPTDDYAVLPMPDSESNI
jgi:hypothetical protein